MLSAGFMLLLFALSITPKQLLHDWITGHKHIHGKDGGQASFQSSAKSFQCNWQEQSVISPFTGEPVFQLASPLIIHTTYINSPVRGIYFTEVFFSSLRGPPCLS